jgi:hypothetical protein
VEPGAGQQQKAADFSGSGEFPSAQNEPASQGQAAEEQR